jgi:drug/metabolite transporter (DMT)-like permease
MQIPFFRNPASRGKAIALGFMVVVLWSTSWVLIKIGLREIPVMNFVALRYSLAFIFIFPLIFRRQQRDCIKQLSIRNWVEIGLLGLVSVAITQSAQFIGLSLLPSVTVSLILNLSPLLVTIIAISFLREIPTGRQWIGVALNLVGVLVYFLPLGLDNSQLLGMGIVFIGLVANSASSLLGRKINREQYADPITVTGLSMGVGAFFLLIGGLGFQGIPNISLSGWLIILFLALVNTAFAFTMWNYIMQTLTAMECSLSLKSILGMVIVMIGGILVQFPQKKPIMPEDGI